MMSKCPNGFYRSGLIRVPIPLQFRLIEKVLNPPRLLPGSGESWPVGLQSAAIPNRWEKLHLRLKKGCYLTSFNSYQARGFDQKAWALSQRGDLVVGTNIL
jgi:hypothetical protein